MFTDFDLNLNEGLFYRVCGTITRYLCDRVDTDEPMTGLTMRTKDGWLQG